MPVPSRWMIRLSFVYLTVAMGLGALMLIHKAFTVHPLVWVLLPVHIEVAIFGWVIQFTLGTAYWMLPRFLEGPPRGSDKLAGAMVTSLNLGIVLVIIDSASTMLFPFRLLGRTLELVAVILFLILHWNRIVTYRKKTT